MHDLTRYALAAAARGWHVFPLTPGQKRPLRGFTDWERQATTDAARIRQMWARAPYNIGIACGPSRLTVIDLDVPQAGDDPPPPEWALPGVHDGSDVLAVLCEQAAEPLLLETFSVRTGRGGTHLYFSTPPDVELGNSAGKLGWKIDTRARGGYVVGPGSRVGSGRYEAIHTAAPAPLPSWLAERLALDPVQPAPRPALGHALGYALTAMRAEVERVLAAAPGTRNNTLNAAAFALGQLAAADLLPRHLAEVCLQSAAEAIGLSAREAFSTIRSGLDSGSRQPRRAA
ncbi:bifunctional DNA primase/polymerase [Nonomuraea sp. NPDC049152]|uniref:bifunctional DNA primase/polymerase n=1 Tax=Nonomuraea sp. NPDC049152 TaxID=3154350 RepID=UPI0033D97DE6